MSLQCSQRAADVLSDTVTSFKSTLCRVSCIFGDHKKKQENKSGRKNKGAALAVPVCSIFLPAFLCLGFSGEYFLSLLMGPFSFLEVGELVELPSSFWLVVCSGWGGISKTLGIHRNNMSLFHKGIIFLFCCFHAS